MATTGKMNDLISAVKSKQFVENELAAFHKFRQDLPATLSYFIPEFSAFY
jgi:hypothetical protein